MNKEPKCRVAETGNLFLKEKFPYIMVFIIGLLLSMGVTHPQFLINDEYITANQLNQIDLGHQFIINEGKFGSYENGTPGTYFKNHQNLLGYPAFAPLISLPALKIVKLIGDPLDYWIFTTWSILLIILGLLIRKCYPGVILFNKLPLSTLLIILGFLIFFLNMVLYIPYTISPDTSPREAAALVMTSNVLFAGLLVIIFDLLHTMFHDWWYTWFGTFVCIADSSYLIWTSSAKDHMLEIFLFSVIIFGLVKFYYTKKTGYCFLSFFVIGLLAWDRPEIGLFTLFFVFISLIPFFMRHRNGGESKRQIVYLLIAPLFTVIGAIPLFINNYIVTNNPFNPMYSVWSTGINATTAGNTVTLPAQSALPGSLVSLAQMVFSRVLPQSPTFIQDFLGILFYPEIGSAGVFILVPIFLIGLLSIPVIVKYRPRQFTSDEIYVILSLLFATISIFVAYISNFHVLNTDPGIAPDVRYLSPVYLPLNIIGLLILSKFPGIGDSSKKMFKYCVAGCCVMIPVFLAVLSIYMQQHEDFYQVFFVLSFWISLFIFIGIIGLLFLPYLYLREKTEKRPFIALAGLLIAVPLAWQIMTIFLISNLANSFAGYNFFLPVIVQINHAFYVFLS